MVIDKYRSFPIYYYRNQITKQNELQKSTESHVYVDSDSVKHYQRIQTVLSNGEIILKIC